VDLEKRVQALEQEVQVLKNQIQATLLDIQEQILTNAYPSLRAESTFVPANPTPVPGPVRQQPKDEPPNLPPEEESPAPVIRKVSLENIPSAPAIEPPSFAALPDSPPVPEIDWSSLAKVEEWVCNRVEKLGTRRTRKLIGMYSGEGRLTPKVADALLRLVDLFEEDDRSVPFEEAPVSWQQTTPRHRGLAPQPAWSDAELPAKRAVYPEPATSSDRSNGSHQAMPPFVAPPEEEAEAPQRLILRLIAGVQNAGVGIVRKKNHG
jgi:hypothetical protein